MRPDEAGLTGNPQPERPGLPPRRPIWPRSAALFTAAGAVLSYIHHRVISGGDGLDLLTYIILALAAGWAGALLGGLADWARGRRALVEPFFPERFGWFYRRGFWFRLAMVFSLAWVLFVALCVAVALGVGAYGEARSFFTPEGAAAILLFVAVFWLEGALVGGVVDLARHVFRK